MDSTTYTYSAESVQAEQPVDMDQSSNGGFYCVIADPPLRSGGLCFMENAAAFRTIRRLRKEVHRNRCLITDEEEPSYAIKARCLLSKDVPEYTLRRLRFVLGRAFSLEEERNQIYLREDMIRPFEAGDWALVPTPELLSTIKNGILEARRSTQLNVNTSCVDFTSLERSANETKREYEYIFLPLGINSKRLPVIRREWSREGPGDRPQFTIHYPPYSDVPHVWSCAHPYFVIMNAHWKLAKYPHEEGHPLSSVWEDIRDIHDMWMGA
ncbi:hypothetical protein BDV93DRAFT_610067 [Ceratobasidium sp. AG-I]|nr:hypothetical protein BDV93DRAFT_610067 [Ceratobasidium sp. AG-I]